MDPTENDRTVLERALRRKEPELSRLIDRLTPIIQARAARCVLRFRGAGAGGVRQQIEDLTQEVMLFLFADDGQVLRKWEPERGLSLDNFVGLLTERQSISMLRTGKRNPWREDTPLPEDDGPVSADVGPEATVASQDALSRLLDLLRAELSPLGWRLFDLLYLQEKGVAEVSATTAMTTDAVYAWRSRLRRLARTLQAGLMSDSEQPARISPREVES